MNEKSHLINIKKTRANIINDMHFEKLNFTNYIPAERSAVMLWCVYPNEYWNKWSLKQDGWTKQKRNGELSKKNNKKQEHRIYTSLEILSECGFVACAQQPRSTYMYIKFMIARLFIVDKCMNMNWFKCKEIASAKKVYYNGPASKNVWRKRTTLLCMTIARWEVPLTFVVGSLSSLPLLFAKS